MPDAHGVMCSLQYEYVPLNILIVLYRSINIVISVACMHAIAT